MSGGGRFKAHAGMLYVQHLGSTLCVGQGAG